MARTVALYGGSFNPPCAHHRRIVAHLAATFDQVVVVPCGPRPDKPSNDDVPPIFRATMVDATFSGMDNVRVDLFDLENQTFTRADQLQDLYQHEGELWHVIGADWVAGGADGASRIQRDWVDGPSIWRDLQFAVIQRPQHELVPADLPLASRVVLVEDVMTSARVRDMIFHHQDLAGLLVPRVAEYILRHGLYRGMRPQRRCHLQLDALRPLVIADSWNDEALALAAELGPSEEREPNLILVVGGDGTMLRAIRAEWRRRVPFYGINTGHLGFLLNRRGPLDCLGEDMVVEQLPLLWCQADGPDGPLEPSLAFNDAWVERTTGQTAWLEVVVNGRQRIERLVADGALISTPAGSTAYARAMGAAPIPITSQALMLVGSNVLLPAFLRPVVLPLDADIELRTLDPDKRPLRGYIDGYDQGLVTSLRTRVSNIAAVELAFDPEYDPAEKLAQIQFPPMSAGS